VLIERHALLGMTRKQLVDAVPSLRGMGLIRDHTHERPLPVRQRTFGE
jgi:hypothetical protein